MLRGETVYHPIAANVTLGGYSRLLKSVVFIRHQNRQKQGKTTGRQEMSIAKHFSTVCPNENYPELPIRIK